MTQLRTINAGCASSKSLERRILYIEGSPKVTARSLHCADAIRGSHCRGIQHISLLGMTKEHRQERKARLALAIAQGRSVAVWAHDNDVPRSTAYRWAGRPEVRAAAESIHCRALNRVLGRLARRAYREAYQLAKLAECAGSESVRLRALRSILPGAIAMSIPSTAVTKRPNAPPPLGGVSSEEKVESRPPPVGGVSSEEKVESRPNEPRAAGAAGSLHHSPLTTHHSPTLHEPPAQPAPCTTHRFGHVHKWTYARKLRKRRHFVSFSLEPKTPSRLASALRIPFRHRYIQSEPPAFGTSKASWRNVYQGRPNGSADVHRRFAVGESELHDAELDRLSGSRHCRYDAKGQRVGAVGTVAESKHLRDRNPNQMNLYQRQASAGLITAFILWATVNAAFAAQPNAGSSAPPRPVAVWPSGPLDVVAAFDKEIDPSIAKGLVGRTIVYSEKVARTGQGDQGAGSLRIVGARLTDGARTLLLATDPHPLVGRYVLPHLEAGARGGSRVNTQDAAIDYDLSGIEATWTAEGDPAERPRWSGWWPLLDSQGTWRVTRGSKPHEECRGLVSKPGRLVLSTMVRLPQGKVTLRLEGKGTVDEAALGDAQAEAPPAGAQSADFLVKLEVESSGEPMFFTVGLRTGAKGLEATLKATYLIGESKTGEPLERDRFILPWAPIPTAASASAPVAVPDLSSGDPVRGRSLFFGDQARCSTCHAFGGQGGKVGPDLSEIGKKGRAEIFRAITAPSASIAPGYTSYTVATDDGQVVAGVVRALDANSIGITDTNARETLIPRTKIQQIRPSATSVMPPALTGALGDSAVRDIIAFLVDPPPATKQDGTASPAPGR